MEVNIMKQSVPISYMKYRRYNLRGHLLSAVAPFPVTYCYRVPKTIRTDEIMSKKSINRAKIKINPYSFA